MTSLFSFVLSRVFGGYLRREPEVLRALDAFEGKLWIEDEALTFTLPGLFGFSLGLYEAESGERLDGSRKSYLRFRKSLYGNPTNQLLKGQGGHVEVAHASPNHDDSVYRLIRIEDSGGPAPQ